MVSVYIEKKIIVLFNKVMGLSIFYFALSLLLFVWVLVCAPSSLTPAVMPGAFTARL